MSASVTAAARTPWAPRHGRLAGARPEQLLAVALDAVLTCRGIGPADIDLVLVACDTGVGAQDLNIARRAVVELGWSTVPALTVDGQRSADLALLGIASSRPGRTIVAALDMPSLVPPGAGLVRDFGRPVVGEPQHLLLERRATAAGLTRAELDAAAERLSFTAFASTPARGVVAVRSGSDVVDRDVGVTADPARDDLAPLAGAGGLLTAAHDCVLADGAAAVVVESGADGRQLQRCRLGATDPHARVDASSDVPGPLLSGEGPVVAHVLAGATGDPRVAPVPALGSAPSADGLRLLVDGFHGIEEAFTVHRAGAYGQWAAVTVAAR